jgi:hypothetical protein
MASKIKSFLMSAIGIDEVKVSSLILVFFISTGFGMYMVITTGDLPPILADFMGLLALMIGGVNVADKVTNWVASFGNRKTQ